jgi:hypothetical protein
MGQAVLFNLAKDLDLVVVFGHVNGVAITSNKRYANCSWMFYVGYIGKLLPFEQLQSMS